MIWGIERVTGIYRVIRRECRVELLGMRGGVTRSEGSGKVIFQCWG